MAETTLMNEEDMLSEDDLEQLAPVYRTYGMDHEHGRIRGMIDGEEACRQAIWKILSTRTSQRYKVEFGCQEGGRGSPRESPN